MKPPLRPLVMATAFACVVGCLLWGTLVRAVVPAPWADDGPRRAAPLGAAHWCSACAVVSARRMSTRAGADAAIVALATATSVLITCVAAMCATITHGLYRGPYGLLGLMFVRTHGAIAVLLLPILAALVVRSLRSTAWLRTARFGAYAASLMLVGLLGMATVVSLRAPSPRQYLGSLPMFARLPAQTQLGSRSNAPETGHCRDVIPLGDVTLVRDCNGRCGTAEAWCSLSVVAQRAQRAPLRRPRSTPHRNRLTCASPTARAPRPPRRRARPAPRQRRHRPRPPRPPPPRHRPLEPRPRPRPPARLDHLRRHGPRSSPSRSSSRRVAAARPSPRRHAPPRRRPRARRPRAHRRRGAARGRAGPGGGLPRAAPRRPTTATTRRSPAPAWRPARSPTTAPA
jgi:hypothetical protein